MNPGLIPMGKTDTVLNFSVPAPESIKSQTHFKVLWIVLALPNKTLFCRILTTVNKKKGKKKKKYYQKMAAASITHSSCLGWCDT